MQKNVKHLFLASLIALNGCAGQRVAADSAGAAAVPAAGADRVENAGAPAVVAKATAAGVLDVVYTTSFPNGSRLTEAPAEIMVVRSETTQKAAAGQVALGILTFALAGGVGFSGFSKESIRGEKIEDVKDRNNIRNPVPTDFIAQLRQQLNAAVEAKPGQYKAAYKQPINVAGGSTRLIYESLTGEEAQQFRMNTELTVYKRKEGASWFSAKPLVQVSCDRVSEKAMPLDDWAKDDYALARQWMDDTLRLCGEKVVAVLPLMLAR